LVGLLFMNQGEYTGLSVAAVSVPLVYSSLGMVVLHDAREGVVLAPPAEASRETPLRIERPITPAARRRSERT
jgi:hypothetical protein